MHGLQSAFDQNKCSKEHVIWEKYILVSVAVVKIVLQRNGISLALLCFKYRMMQPLQFHYL